MSEFKRLLLVLEKELSHHEKLLDLLTRERAAIVTLNPEQLGQLNVEKEQVLSAAKECEDRRRELIESITAGSDSSPVVSPSASSRVSTGSNYADAVNWKGQTAVQKPSPAFSEVVSCCPLAEVRSELTKIGTDLKNTAEVVRDMNNHNAQLIKQSLGLISSTLSIIRSTPGSDLPTYGQRGELRDAGEDPAFAGRSSGVTRQA